MREGGRGGGKRGGMRRGRGRKVERRERGLNTFNTEPRDNILEL